LSCFFAITLSLIHVFSAPSRAQVKHIIYYRVGNRIALSGPLTMTTGIPAIVPSVSIVYQNAYQVRIILFGGGIFDNLYKPALKAGRFVPRTAV
jgi:hypothetical protein